MKVFVYGTLRKELGNHYLLQDSVYLGTGVTAQQYLMLESSVGHSIPYVVKPNEATKNHVSNIEGQLYEVDDLTLAHLDRLEGHPGWYKREYVDVVVDNDTIKAMMYMMPWSEFKHRTLLYVNESGDFFQSPTIVPMALLV